MLVFEDATRYVALTAGWPADPTELNSHSVAMGMESFDISDQVPVSRPEETRTQVGAKRADRLMARHGLIFNDGEEPPQFK